MCSDDIVTKEEIDVSMFQLVYGIPPARKKKMKNLKTKVIIAALVGSFAVAFAAFADGPPFPATWYRAGSVTFGKFIHLTDIKNTITALAGGAQSATATTLQAVNEVTVVASSNDSITLPTPVSPFGINFFITNSAASNALKIFGVTPVTINGIGTATGYSLAAGKAAHCISVSATNYACVGP
jgi:hypothetical protein